MYLRTAAQGRWGQYNVLTPMIHPLPKPGYPWTAEPISCVPGNFSNHEWFMRISLCAHFISQLQQLITPWHTPNRCHHTQLTKLLFPALPLEMGIAALFPHLSLLPSSFLCLAQHFLAFMWNSKITKLDINKKRKVMPPQNQTQTKKTCNAPHQKSPPPPKQNNLRELDGKQ